MLLPAHRTALDNIKEMFTDCGYELSFELLNAADFWNSKDRKRVFFVGYRKDLGIKFEFPKTNNSRKKDKS